MAASSRVSYKGEKPVTNLDLGKMSGVELANLMLSPNDWYARTARRLLQERGRSVDAEAALQKILQQGKETTHRLRALWALYGMGALESTSAFLYLRHQDEYVRAWALQLMPVSELEKQEYAWDLLGAATGKSQIVQLYLASALQRFSPEKRWDLIAAILSHAETASDKNIPLMAWWATEPLVPLDPDRALSLGLKSVFPNQLRYTARRAASIATQPALAALTDFLRPWQPDKKVKPNALSVPKALAVLGGILDALKGGVKLPASPEFAEVINFLSNEPKLEMIADHIGARIGNESGRQAMRDYASDPSFTDSDHPEQRLEALQTLVAIKDEKLPSVLHSLLKDQQMRDAALRALGNIDDAETPTAVLAVYASLDEKEKRSALAALVSRVSYAKELMAAIGAGKIPAHDLTAELVRQARQFNDATVNAALDKQWGTMRVTPEAQQKEIARIKEIYKLGGSAPGDPRRGRAIFNRTCAQCHTLFETGGKVGPDLTGSNRANLDYLMENVVTPNAVIPNDYRAAIVTAKDGRVLMGVVKQQSPESLTLATMTESVTLPRSDVAKMEISEVSMMPEGLLTALNDQEIRDFILYMKSTSQVPLP